MSTWQSRDSPINRFRKYLEKKGWWSAEEEAAFKKSTRSQVLKAFMDAEKVKKPRVSELFSDVYDTLPPALHSQKAELERIMKLYPEHYDQKDYEPEN